MQRPCYVPTGYSPVESEGLGSAVKKRPKALLVDLDGVIYQEGRLIEGAAETVDWIRSQSIPYRFLTNTSSKPRRAVVQKLAAMGIEEDEEHILTPPIAATDWLREHIDGPVALFVNEETKEDFDGVAILESDNDDDAAAVVLGDLGKGWSFERLNRAFRHLMTDARPPLLALGMTRYWRTDGGLQLDVGPFVRALEYATGRQAVVLGKPAVEFFLAAIHALDCEPGDALMIGDDRVGDVEGAEAAGIPGALVQTGKFQQEDLVAEPPPRLVFKSISNLPEWIGGRT